MFSFIGTWSCKQAKPPEENCSNFEEIEQISNLKIGDQLIDFGAVSNHNRDFQLSELEAKFFILFFKNETPTKELNILINEEVVNHDLGKKTIDKQGTLLVLNEGKLLEIYGISQAKMKNVLIIADENKQIRKMFKNACERRILDFLNEQ
jgi:hypothetical protein